MRAHRQFSKHGAYCDTAQSHYATRQNTSRIITPYQRVRPVTARSRDSIACVKTRIDAVIRGLAPRINAHSLTAARPHCARVSNVRLYAWHKAAGHHHRALRAARRRGTSLNVIGAHRRCVA